MTKDKLNDSQVQSELESNSIQKEDKYLQKSSGEYYKPEIQIQNLQISNFSSSLPTPPSQFNFSKRSYIQSKNSFNINKYNYLFEY